MAHTKRKAVRRKLSESANHSWESHYVLYCDWSIRLLLTSYCLTFLYVPWAYVWSTM